MRSTLSRPALVLGLTFCVSSGSAATLTLRIVDGGGEPLQHAVVTLSGEHGTMAAEGLVSVSQEGQQFSPRVTVVPRGTTVRFPNRDITQHHVYSFSEAKPFELELYAGDAAEPVLFDRAGIVALGCNIHDWMLGYVYVTDDPWFDVSGESGVVVLPSGPAPDELLTVWHPAASQALSMRFGDLSPSGPDLYEVTIETVSPDPLDFEIDPLQHLLSESLE